MNEIDSHFDQIFEFFLQLLHFFAILFVFLIWSIILLVLLICCFSLYFFKFLENFTFLIDADRWQRLLEQLYRILLILEYLIVLTSWARWSQELLHQVSRQIEEAHQLNFALELLQVLFARWIISGVVQLFLVSEFINIRLITPDQQPSVFDPNREYEHLQCISCAERISY